MRTHTKKHARISLYIFRQQGNVLFNLCFVFHKMSSILCGGTQKLPETFSGGRDPDEIVHMLHHTYDVAYAQFHQDPLGSLKMALVQRRNM
jgi:hypothetical protein